jgi:putative tricarboxylic transport membrane protein
MGMDNTKREIITDVTVLIGALLVLFYVIPTTIDLEQEYGFASLSPAFFPTIATWLIAGLTSLHLLSIIAGRKGSVGPEAGDEWLSTSELWKALASCGAIIAYFFLMKVIGFIISTALVLAFLFWFQGVKKPMKVALISILVTAGIYFFFLYVMKVHFPKGILFE